jgi:glutathione S-transferase
LFVLAATLVMHTALAPFLGLTTSPDAVKQAEKLLSQSLDRIESVWLNGGAKFLLGNPQPSVADLSLVCEIMQLEVSVFPASIYSAAVRLCLTAICGIADPW